MLRWCKRSNVASALLLPTLIRPLDPYRTARKVQQPGQMGADASHGGIVKIEVLTIGEGRHRIRHSGTDDGHRQYPVTDIQQIVHVDLQLYSTRAIPEPATYLAFGMGSTAAVRSPPGQWPGLGSDGSRHWNALGGCAPVHQLVTWDSSD